MGKRSNRKKVERVGPAPAPTPPAKPPKTQFQVTFRDKEHFYRCVNWLNKNVGQGIRHWKITRKVVAKLKYGPVVRTVLVYDDDFSKEEAESTALFLTLL